MARIRTIKPEFFTSEDITGLSAMARLLYIATWCEADRSGRLAWKPNTFKLRYFPGDNCKIHDMCQELVDARLVVLYDDGLAYIPTFPLHQHVNPRETISKLPEPTCENTRRDASNLDENAQGGREGKGREGKGREGVSPGGSVGKTDPLPRCDKQAIVDLYHQVLPELPSVKLMTEDRKKKIPKFWEFVLTSKKSDDTPRATTADEALAWIRSYFERARENDFLMGRLQKSPGHENWQADLDYLMTEKGRKQVIEKTLVNP